MTHRDHVSPVESLNQRRRQYTAKLHPEVVADLYERVNSGAISIELATLIADVLGPGEWREQAACRGMDPSLWFRDGQGAPGLAAARRICAECPVRQECFEYANDAPELDGVWAGYGTSARRRGRNTTPFSAPTTVCIDCCVALDSRQRVRCDRCVLRNKHERNSSYVRRDAHRYGWAVATGNKSRAAS